MPMLLSKYFLTTYYAGGEYYPFREINQVHSDARNSIVSIDKKYNSVIMEKRIHVHALTLNVT